MLTEEKILFVSLIMPCRNEEKYIQSCLDSILAGDYPSDRLEIIVVDGMSEDNTRQIVLEYCQKFSNLRLLDNPKKNVMAAMNRGIEASSGDVIFKMDAHSIFEENYVSSCVKVLVESGADNVGGKFVIKPGANTAIAEGIAYVMGHSLGIGRYYEWMHSLEEPTEVETVSFGCFRKDMLAKRNLGFNEELSRGGDSEFNKRLRAQGGNVLLFPHIVFDYFARPSLSSLWKHQFSCGYWVVYWTRFKGELTLRSCVPMLFLVGLFASLVVALVFPQLLYFSLIIPVSYLAVIGFYSLKLAIKEKKFRLLFLMPLVFGTLHISRGLGSLYGGWRRLWSKK